MSRAAVAAKPAGVLSTAGHAGRQAPVGAIHGGPDVADRAIDDISEISPEPLPALRT